MQDFKHLHHSNQQPKPQHTTFLEMLAINTLGVLVMMTLAYTVIYVAFMQATGGF